MFAGLEGGSRVLQIALNITNERVRAPEHAPRDPLYFLERRNCLAEIVEGGVRACVEHLRVLCRPRTPRRPPRRPLCIFCLHYTVLRCRRGEYVYKSACGRGASGHAGKWHHNSA